MPMLNMRYVLPDHLIDLNRVDGLRYIRDGGADENGVIEIGAMTLQRDIEFADVVRKRCPLMHEAIAQVGHRQTRNRGTLGATPGRCRANFRATSAPPEHRSGMALSNASGVRILAREVDRDDLDVTADHVLVLKNGGPKGGPGMPEWGQLPIPKKRLKAGVRDMLRISDARMSGTSYGACILHVAPESFIGGPLALVQTGDEIEVDVAARRIHLHVGADELARRATPGNRRRRAIRAATGRCFAPISARPTKVASSIFCRVMRRSRNPKFTARPAALGRATSLPRIVLLVERDCRCRAGQPLFMRKAQFPRPCGSKDSA